MLLLTTWFGTFLLEDDKVVRTALFPKDPQQIASRLRLIEDWKVLDEEREFLRAAPEVFVTEPRLERAGGKLLAVTVPFLKAEDHGFDRKLLHEAMVLVAKAQMRRAPRPDDHLAQVIAALDDVTESYNLLLERLRAWYALHYPELARLVDDRTYTALIAEHGDRGSMPREAGESIGGELGSRERTAVMEMAATARRLAEERDHLAGYLEKASAELAPNVTRLVGPVIAAHLLARAGGLEALARLPTSTIQTLGAEKAFFRHLKDGTPPPKHGVLFQHPWVHGAPPWQRGSIARAFAGKIAIAARADYFSKRDLGNSLREDLERAIRELERRKARPPPRKAQRPRPKKRRR